MGSLDDFQDFIVLGHAFHYDLYLFTNLLSKQQFANLRLWTNERFRGNRPRRTIINAVFLYCVINTERNKRPNLYNHGAIFISHKLRHADLPINETMIIRKTRALKADFP